MLGFQSATPETAYLGNGEEIVYPSDLGHARPRALRKHWIDAYSSPSDAYGSMCPRKSRSALEYLQRLRKQAEILVTICWGFPGAVLVSVLGFRWAVLGPPGRVSVGARQGPTTAKRTPELIQIQPQVMSKETVEKLPQAL